MCAPLAIPVLAAAAGAGGAAAAGASTTAIIAAGVMGAASGASAGAEMEAAEYNVKVAEQHQDQLETEAENVRIAGSQEAGRQQIETQKQLARGRAEAGARGISSTAGTPGQVAEDVAEVGMLEQMTILNNADRQAFGMEVQGMNEVDQAEARKKTAKTKGYTSILGAAAGGYASGLTAAASVAPVA